MVAYLLNIVRKSRALRQWRDRQPLTTPVRPLQRFILMNHGIWVA